MKIATLSIGDELVFGEIADTNAAHVAARLYRDGIRVQRHLTVGDSEPDIMEAIIGLADKCEMVIATGGLGPTADDITARAAARVAGRRLVLNDEALAHLRDFFALRGAEMHPHNEKQALLPAKAVIVPNPTGTACGFHLTHNGRYLFFLPGVPSEMARMLDETVIPFILERQHQRNILKTRVLRVFGLTEAEIGALIQGIEEPLSGLTIAYCVNFPEILVKLRVEGGSGPVLEELLSRALAKAREKLAGFIVAEDDETIDTVVARLFREKGMTLSLAESCTGGLVAKRITDLAGSSTYFLEGVVTYADRAKSRLLQVPPELIAEKGAVSAEVARAMARGSRFQSGSDLAVAVTGIAGPDGGTAEKPVGTVFIALADRAGCSVKGYRFSGSREQVRSITSYTVMDWLRRKLVTFQS